MKRKITLEVVADEETATEIASYLQKLIADADYYRYKNERWHENPELLERQK